MSVGAGLSPEGSGELVLRWSEAPDSPSSEQIVQVIQSNVHEAVIRSACRVREGTQVRLVGKKYTGDGVVRSCREEGKSFILRIAVGADVMIPYVSDRDPGALVIDEFLTAEQEAKILEDLEKDAPREAILPANDWSNAYTRSKTVSLISILYRLRRVLSLAPKYLASARPL